MKCNAQFTVVRCFAAAAVLCGLLNWFAARAAASCGDYVLIHDLDAGDLHSGTPLANHHQAGGMPDTSALPGRPDRSAPCHGPNCSKRSVPPLDPSPSPSSSLEWHDWSWSAPEIAAVRLDSTRWIALEVCPRPVFLGKSIFRPPRLPAPALA
ncbi:MAG TPA: hypothetical protein VMV10_12835 [Pirellulales bacterium]|nr:hypothetical protein [Pirellulales bacterium]